jgi:hypothetical protein
VGSIRDRQCGCSDEEVDTALDQVCSMPPLQGQERRERIHDLLARATAWASREDGVFLEFPGTEDTARTLLEFVLAERRCCAHFAYELGFAPDDQRVTLRLRASGAYVAPLKTIYAGLARHRMGRPASSSDHSTRRRVCP